MGRVLFQRGWVVTEDARAPELRDVLVENGRIAGVDPHIEVDAATPVIDCNEKFLVPGLFDMHVHLREPGREDKETLETGTEAAVNGGITGILAMPNTEPAIDTGGMVRFVLNLARERSRIPVYTAGCVSRGRAGRELAEIGDMVEKGAVMITDDGDPVSDARLLRRAMEYSRNFKLLIGSHAEVRELSEGGVVNEGAVSYKLGLPGIPSASEEIAIDRDLRIAQWTRARIHIHHVSASGSIEIIRRFKQQGLPVSCEVTPHHLIFCDKDIVDYNTNLKMNPPLRRDEDRARLLEGLKEGVIDCIATDHAPHTTYEKNEDYCSAPFGIIGLETALLSLYTHLIKTERLSWGRLASAFSSNPRKLLGLDPVSIRRGNRADFLVFDPQKKTRVDRAFLKSKSCNTPFLGKDLDGSVELVTVSGQIVLDRTKDGRNRVTCSSK